jgi:hypothetical protein
MADLLSILVLSAVLVLGLSLLLFQFVTGVPPHPPGAAEAADVVALLREATRPGDAIIHDLGCDWGSSIIAVAQRSLRRISAELKSRLCRTGSPGFAREISPR